MEFDNSGLFDPLPTASPKGRGARSLTPSPAALPHPVMSPSPAAPSEFYAPAPGPGFRDDPNSNPFGSNPFGSNPFGSNPFGEGHKPSQKKTGASSPSRAGAELQEALFDATRANNPEGCARALDQGALVNARGVNDLTPLHICGVSDASAAARELLRRGADCEQLDSNRRTPLHAAALSQGYEVMGLLLSVRAFVNPRDMEGKTPLCSLAWNGGEEGVALLLKAGADPNAADKEGRSPLHLAVKSGNGKTGVIKRLLAAGANPLARDSNGISALDLAEQAGDRTAVSLFKNFSPMDNRPSAPYQEREAEREAAALPSRLREQRSLRSGAPLNVKRRSIPTL